MLARRVLPVLALGCGLAGTVGTADANPQITSDLSVGGGARFTSRGAEGVFSLALRADVLFGGAGPYVPRVGPFVAVRSDNLGDIAPSAGLSFLLPVSSTYPLVISAGGVMDVRASTDLAGVVTRVWWGGRSYNYNAPYGLTVGLWAEGRYFPSDGSSDLIAGLDIDLEVFAMPVILIYNWLAH